MDKNLLNAHPRLIEGPWRELYEAEQYDFLPRLELHLIHSDAPLLTRTHLFLESWAAPLPFYPGAMLVTSRVEGPDGSIGVLDVVLARGVIFCLSGSSGLIHAFNAGDLQPLPATDATVCHLLGQPHGRPLAGLDVPAIGTAYLRFFCGAVRGEEGGFHIVESADHLARLGVVDERGELAALIEPMRWCGQADPVAEGRRGWLIEAHVVYAGRLFATQFRLMPDGNVVMEDDTELAGSICPAEVHNGLVRSIVLPAEPKHRRTRSRGKDMAAAAPGADAPDRVSVPAHRVLSVRDPLLERLCEATSREIDVGAADVRALPNRVESSGAIATGSNGT